MLKLFYSYCHDDKNWLAAVRNYCDRLADPPLSLVEIFCDDALQPGVNWPQVLNDELCSCDVFVPVVTQRFLSSKACVAELRQALELQQESKAGGGPELPAICPIICGRNTFRDQFGNVQPLLEWRDYLKDPGDEEMLLRVYERLRDAVRGLGGPPANPAPQAALTPAAPESTRGGQETRIYSLSEKDYDLLPFLCDHHRQVEALSKTLETSLKDFHQTRAAKPLVFLASGPERQSHTAFRIRLRRHTLPRALGDPSVPTPWNDLRWPPGGECGMAELDRAAPHWNTRDAVTLLTVAVSPRQWDGVAGLKTFLRFLHSLGAPAGGAEPPQEPLLKCRALVVGIFLVYRDLESERERAMRESVNEAPFAGLSGIYGCCLAEFADADSDDAEEWIEMLYRDNALTDYERFKLEGMLRSQLAPLKSIAVQDLVTMAEQVLANIRNLPRKVS